MKLKTNPMLAMLAKHITGRVGGAQDFMRNANLRNPQS